MWNPINSDFKSVYNPHNNILAIYCFRASLFRHKYNEGSIQLPDELPNNLKTLEIRKYYENLRTGFGHKLVLNSPLNINF